MKNTIDGLDEMDDIEFGPRIKARPLLRQIGEAVGWLILLAGIVLVMLYLTPPQRSAEADLFEAQANGEVAK